MFTTLVLGWWHWGKVYGTGYKFQVGYMFHVHGLWHWLWFMTLYTGWFYDTGTEGALVDWLIGALDWGPNISQSDIRVILIGPIRRQKWNKIWISEQMGRTWLKNVFNQLFLTLMSGRILPLHRSKRLTKTWQHSYIMIAAHDCNKWQMHVKSKKHSALCSSAMQKNIVSKMRAIVSFKKNNINQYMIPNPASACW